MLSLVLTTTLLLAPTATISTLDNEALIGELINQQVQVTNQLVSRNVELATQDTFLLQAKLAIKSAELNDDEFDKVAE